MEKLIHVLMIEDDEDDFLIASRLLDSAAPNSFQLERRDCLREGLSAIGPETEVVLLDRTTPRSNCFIAAPVMEPCSTRSRRKARAQFPFATALVLPASEVSSAQRECWPRMRAGSAPQQRPREQILREEDL